MKRSILLNFLLLFFASLLPQFAKAFIVDGIAYRLVDNDVVVTSSPSYSNLSGEITIPSSVPFNFGAPDYPNIQYLTVKGVDNNAFEGCTSLTGVTFESGTSIGDRAFSGCTGLSSVNISNSWTDIGSWAFEGCTSLTNITIPEHVWFVGEGAFSGCTALETVNWNAKSCNELENVFYELTGITSFNFGNNVEIIPARICCGLTGLTSLTIPESVKSIGDLAFYECSGLSGTLNIPNSVSAIGELSFYNCNSLISLIIGDSVISIGESAFYNCTSLTSAVIGNSVTSIGAGAFACCKCLNSLTMGNSVASICDYSFVDCSGLTSVVIPNTVTEIGTSAFDGCNTLCSLYSKIEDPESVSYGSYIFEGVNKNHCKLYVPTGTIELYQSTSPWSDFLNIFEEGSGIETTPVYGDVNGDGVVTSADVTAIYDILLGNNRQ